MNFILVWCDGILHFNFGNFILTHSFKWRILGSVVLLNHTNYVQRFALPAVAKKVQTD